MKVTVTIPDQVYGRLANLADDRNARLDRLIGDAMLLLLGQTDPPKNRGPVVTDEVAARMREWHRLNWSFADMSRELGMSYDTIIRAARRMGLSPLKGARTAARREGETKGNAA